MEKDMCLSGRDEGSDEKSTANRWPERPDADLVSILGRPNFACISLAQLLRRQGWEIASKAEHEQAAVLCWLLGFWFRHGNQWHEYATQQVETWRKGTVDE